MGYKFYSHPDYNKMSLRELIEQLQYAIHNEYAIWDCYCGSEAEREGGDFYPEQIEILQIQIANRLTELGE
ncbi:hypothetical protein CPT_Moby_081 [Stenotrophomonas phage Moby]|uniref:Uncharacterized protein n=1 Tax=Stenotrophomonas phage Moby TaxID=2601680 RepID=A0A5P8PMD8_9CAUD|nr:hypothetical protein HWC58_gp081 [Stenotrophomonas phage Moby]QFR57829.1 hypothetical protein CPT_Moby_081 [Stenotrophomonas phage Moby]